MPVSSQPSECHLTSEEDRGSVGSPSRLNPMQVWVLSWLLWHISRPWFLRVFVWCRRCTSALSWSVGKHKISLFPQMIRPQTLPSMFLKTGQQVSFYSMSFHFVSRSFVSSSLCHCGIHCKHTVCVCAWWALHLEAVTVARLSLGWQGGRRKGSAAPAYCDSFSRAASFMATSHWEVRASFPLKRDHKTDCVLVI